MDEWFAIDLHMHTVSGFTRDKKTDRVNFSYTKFVQVLKKYDLKLMSVTNHNFIDMTNLILMKHLAKKANSNILMGVELDSTMQMGTPIHIACIFGDDFNVNYIAAKNINCIVEHKITTSNEIVFSPREVIDFINNYDFIMIPHGNKDKGIFKEAGPKQIEEALKKIREGFIRIFDSRSDWKLEKIKQYLEEIGEENLDQFGGVLFSDIRDWDTYDDLYRDFYMNAEPTYKGLIHSITNPVKRFKQKDDIVYNTNYIKKIVFRNLNNQGRIRNGEINFSAGYNCVIGKSGTGKSLLMHLIKSKLIDESVVDKDKERYSFANNTEVEIYNENGLLLDGSRINIGIGVNLFDKIIKASASNDNNNYYEIIKILSKDFIKEEQFNIFKSDYNKKISEYYNLKKDNDDRLAKLKEKFIVFKENNKKMQQLKNIKVFNLDKFEQKSDSKHTSKDIETFSKYSEDLFNIKQKVDLYKGSNRTKLEEALKKLGKIFENSLEDMKYDYLYTELKNKKTNIINNSILTINSGISAQAKEKAQLTRIIPEDRKILVDMILQTYKTECELRSFDLRVNHNDCNSQKNINEDENIVVYENIKDEIFTDVNERDNIIFKTYGKKGMLDSRKNYNIMKFEEARELIDKYISVEIIDNTSNYISDNLKVDVKVFFDGQNVDELNPGDIAKKYIQLYFKENITNGTSSVILFDQIENDVDKDFINKVIKDLIESTKGKVQLIVVTHDPIVAVNADPNNYIEATKERNIISYRSFVAESSIKDELETIANTVDGSKLVIKARYEIYEGDKSYDNRN